MRYELWHSACEGCHTFFPTDQRPADLPPDARLLWSVEATTWDEAQTAKHEFLGWEPYIPLPEANAANGEDSIDRRPSESPPRKRSLP